MFNDAILMIDSRYRAGGCDVTIIVPCDYEARHLYMKRCYVCDRLFNANTVLDHGEHVIPNAIGGGLIAKGILCQDCGTSLGNSVDRRFCEALKALCVVFDIWRDRGGQVNAPALVTIRSEFSIAPASQEFSIEYGADPVPRAPIIIKDDVAKVAHLFGANAEQVRNYEKAGAVLALQKSGYAIRTTSSIRDLIERVALEIRPNSLDIARGIIKIAVAFALKAGVKSALIQHFVVDKREITNDDSKISRAVQPYFPTGWCEAVYEADRYETDDFPPNHQLILFSLGNKLYCHVDLFGVIQRYVLLSEKWHGPAILKRYLQKCPRWIFSSDDWMARRSKDLDLLARQFEVRTEARSWEDIQEEVLKKASARPYELSAANQLEKPREMLSILAALPMDKHSSFPTVEAVRQRADVAEAEFGSDFLITLATDRLRTLNFIRDLDINQLRVTNEHGPCPDLSAATPSSTLWEYQKFRLGEFVRAFADSWSIEINTVSS